MTISASTLRNIIAILRNIDRDQIEAEIGRMPDAGWASFRDDPYRHFLRMTDHGQAGVARIVSERMEPVAVSTADVDRDSNHIEMQILRAEWESGDPDFHGEPPALQSALEVRGASL